jgi:exonuclease VII large subunit
MNAAAERQMLLAKNKLALLKNSMQFGAIAAKFQDKRNQFMQTAAALTRAVKLNNERAGQQILNLEGRLAAMSPEKVLQRGYAILTESATGKIITQPGLPAAARVKAMVAGGSINLVVE